MANLIEALTTTLPMAKTHARMGVKNPLLKMALDPLNLLLMGGGALGAVALKGLGRRAAKSGAGALADDMVSAASHGRDFVTDWATKVQGNPALREARLPLADDAAGAIQRTADAPIGMESFGSADKSWAMQQGGDIWLNKDRFLGNALDTSFGPTGSIKFHAPHLSAGGKAGAAYTSGAHEASHVLTGGVGRMPEETEKYIINELLHSISRKAPWYRRQGIAPDLSSNWFKYVNNPDELYARVNQARATAGLRPEDLMTPEKVRQIPDIKTTFDPDYHDAEMVANLMNKLPVAAGVGSGAALASMLSPGHRRDFKRG